MWVKLALWLLRHKELSLVERNLLTGGILESIKSLPLRDIISASEQGSILIDGQELDIEKARMLRESARAALINQALKIIHERVMWTAVREGLAKGLPAEDLLFFRAAIWFGEQLIQHLKTLAGLANDQEPVL